MSGNGPTVLGLFSGAGGLELGFEQAGFRVLGAVELEPIRCRTLRKNTHWNVIQSDIRALTAGKVLAEIGEKPDVLIAGPPCQQFSKGARWTRPSGPDPNDSRTSLVFEVTRLAASLRPDWVLIENVACLAHKPGRPYLGAIHRKLRRAGYSTFSRVHNALDFSVPQKRKRVIIVGALNCEPSAELKILAKQHRRPLTAGESIGPLDDGIVADDERPKGRWAHLLDAVPPGGNYMDIPSKPFKPRSRYWNFLLKLDPNLPSWTISARPGPYAGPFHWRSRRLRIPEIRRLQAFPDDWRLCGGPREQWAQLGDAVPPPLACAIGDAIHRTMET